MNLVATKISEFVNLYDELAVLLTENQKEMSQVDTDLSKLYHKIEGVEIKHVSESHALIKELKAVLNKRREIKFNYIQLSAVAEVLKGPMGKFKSLQVEKLDKHNKIIEKLSNNNQI